MAEQAVSHGVPKNKIVIADIADMSIERSIVSRQHLETVFSETSTQLERLRIKGGSVDHIFSHSVIWALAAPEAFFAEAQRVLKQGGTLAISTVGENLHPHRQYFIDYLEKHLSAAVGHGTVSHEQKRTFVEQNRGITEAAKSPLSVKQLVEFGERHGFEVKAVADCYVVETPKGPRPYFHQVLYRKK
jgi:ubiquinone/menaquinone biosynthesis C-methylase UbiE